MVNLLADHGQTAIKLDRMAKSQMSSRTSERSRQVQAKGIQNSGNICFASSVAQILYRMDAVHDFILNIGDKLDLPKEELDPILGLKQLFKALDDPAVGSVKGHAGKFVPGQFPRGEQGDSEEFFTVWMGLVAKAMGEDRRDELFLKVSLNRTTGNGQTSVVSTDFWSTIKVNFPEMAIAQNRPLPLEDLLAHSQGPFGEEHLSGGIRQIYRIESVPKTLVISFGRTAYHPKKGLVKINTPVQVPETINLTPFITSKSSSFNSTQATLKMFVLHKGNAPEGGHYVAYVQDTQDQWQIIDDENVRNIPKQEALESVKYASLCFFSIN